MGKKLNGAIRDMGNNRKVAPYYGTARFIEIAPPGTNFRMTINVDAISSLDFGVQKNESHDKDGNPSELPPIQYLIAIGVEGQSRQFHFIDAQIAADFYHSIQQRINVIGVPISVAPRIKVEPVKSTAADDGDAIPGLDDLEEGMVNDETQDQS